MTYKKKTAFSGLFLLLLLACAVSGCSFLGHTYYLPVTLVGDREVTIEYGQTYTEPGASAVFYDDKASAEGVEVEVSMKGEVDTTIPGDYTIAYIARYQDCVGTAYRTVHVVDVQPPQIVLHTKEGHYTLPGSPYQEEGFTATDDCDGDLTDRVVSREADGVVTYTVKDAAGNVTIVTRQITYNDPIPPEITLLGSADMEIGLGSSFSDPGYTATDNCDGDLTAQVRCVGRVDTSRAGFYTLTYHVTDTYGNEATISRMVTVVDYYTFDGVVADPPFDMPALPEVVVPNGKVIYLTFDDGPSSYTPYLLDVLAKYNVKATFFVVNNSFLGTVERIAREGHTVALHSSSHNYQRIYASEDAYFADLYALQQRVYEICGVTPTILRFPGGTSNTVSRFNPGIMTRLTQLVTEKGFRYFDWNVDSKDAGGATTVDEVARNVINGISSRNISVVLQHDIKGYSVRAVEQIIVWGLSNGYTFLPLTADSPACEHSARN